MSSTSYISQVDATSLRNQNSQNFGFHDPPDFKGMAARSNRLWLLAFVLILVAAGVMIRQLGKTQQQVDQRAEKAARVQRLAPFPGVLHQDASVEIKDRVEKDLGIKPAWVRFISKDQVEVELPAAIDRDRVPAVVSLVNEVSQKRLNEKPAIRIYFAKTPGVGPRTRAPISPINVGRAK